MSHRSISKLFVILLSVIVLCSCGASGKTTISELETSLSFDNVQSDPVSFCNILKSYKTSKFNTKDLSNGWVNQETPSDDLLSSFVC